MDGGGGTHRRGLKGGAEQKVDEGVDCGQGCPPYYAKADRITSRLFSTARSGASLPSISSEIHP
jgi:hypothetical protein